MSALPLTGQSLPESSVFLYRSWYRLMPVRQAQKYDAPYPAFPERHPQPSVQQTLRQMRSGMHCSVLLTAYSYDVRLQVLKDYPWHD